MSSDEFQELWKAHDRKLERSLQLNLRLLTDLQKQKARSALRSPLASGVVGIVVGVLWELLMAFLLYCVRTQPVMAVSFGAFFIFTAIGIGGYIRDISVIHTVSYTDDVLYAQERLARLRSAMIRTQRVMWLQLPFWSTFFVSNAMIRDGLRPFLLIQVPVFLFFAAVALFLYRNITVENAQRKKWVAAFIRGSGAGSVARAIGLLKEIEEFRREDAEVAG
jgi:hypothetical protein